MTVKIFYSYSHKDEELRARLIDHLSTMKREGLVDEWHDRRLEPGHDWDREIRAELERADLILFLVSSDFISSTYCYDVEVSRALERDAKGEARVVPIILREVDWEGSVFGHLTALPTDGKAVCSAQWHSQDQAFTDVARGLRRLVKRIAGPPPPGKDPVNLPTNLTQFHRRNPHLTGREPVLEQIDSLLPLSGGGLVTVFGLGGVGKTQTAAEFAFRRCRSVLTWWLPAEEPNRLLAEYCALAPGLGIDSRRISDLGIIAHRVRAALETKPGWLLVFDNVDSPGDLLAFLPSSAAGNVFVTTRNPNFGVLGQMLELKPWDRNTAAQFLAHRTTQPDVAAELLADELGALPLACEQAAAYIVATGISLAGYLDLFYERRRELWGEEARHLREIGERVTVSTVWELSLSKVGESEPAAIELLRLLGFMAAEAVPIRVISQYGWMATGALARAAGNALALNRIIGALRRYSLIDRLDVAVRVHRLVQTVIRDRMSPSVQSQWIGCAVRIAEAAFQFDKEDPDSWPFAREILPHAVTTAAWHAEWSPKSDGLGARTTHAESQSATEAVSSLLKKLGSYFRISSQYEAARLALGRALEIDQIRTSIDYRSLAVTTIELGHILREQGNFQGSREAQERAIEICTCNDEFESRRVGAALLSLGQVMRAEGNIVSAIRMFRKAMAIATKGSGKDDADLATILNHYGEALAEQGDFPEAHQALQRAVALDQSVFGLAHPNVGRDFLGLAKMLRLKDDLDPAKRANERALKIYEATYQADHPAIADALMDYAETLACDDKAAAARLRYNQALRIYESSYGTAHIKYANATFRIGQLEAEMGEHESALHRFRAARDVCAKFYGADHALVQDIDRQIERSKSAQSSF